MNGKRLRLKRMCNTKQQIRKTLFFAEELIQRHYYLHLLK